MQASGLVAAGIVVLGSPAFTQEQSAQEGGPSVVAQSVCLTNACSKSAAIKLGDVNQVMELSGTPGDVINAMRSRLAKDPDALLNPQSANSPPLRRWMASVDNKLAKGQIPTFIQENGRTLLAFFSPDGRFIASTVPPGLNAPGRAPVGMALHVPTPAEIEAQVAADFAKRGLRVPRP